MLFVCTDTRIPVGSFYGVCSQERPCASSMTPTDSYSCIVFMDIFRQTQGRFHLPYQNTVSKSKLVNSQKKSFQISDIDV
jgi:hypothetical protein